MSYRTAALHHAALLTTWRARVASRCFTAPAQDVEQLVAAVKELGNNSSAAAIRYDRQNKMSRGSTSNDERDDVGEGYWGESAVAKDSAGYYSECHRVLCYYPLLVAINTRGGTVRRKQS